MAPDTGIVNLRELRAKEAAADPRLPFAAQAQDLAVARAGWNGDLEHLAVGERDLPLGAVDRVEEIDLETIMRVRPPHAKIAPAPAAEYFRENVLAARKIGKARIAGIGRRAAAVGEVAIEALARAFGAGRVDLAAVEARPLLGIAQKRVGGGDFLELFLGLFVAGIEIRVKFLGKAPIGLLDVLRGGILLHAQDLIRICRQRVLLYAAFCGCAES